MLYKVVPTHLLLSLDEFLQRNQIKAKKKLLSCGTVLWKMVLTFESTDEILKCDQSNESHQVVFFGTGVLLACCIARIHVLRSFLIMRGN